MLCPISNRQYNLNFNANLKSPKLRFSSEDFFIKIRGYGRNKNWADEIVKTADEAVKNIRKKQDFETVLKKIVKGVAKANKFPLDLNKRERTGVLRIKRDGWDYNKEYASHILVTNYEKKGDPKYKSYRDRFDYIMMHPLERPYDDISLTVPACDNDGIKYLRHGNFHVLNDVFTRLENIYNSILDNFKGEKVNDDDMYIINDKVAEMRWILAHATPWERGSDAISNVLMRSILKAFGIKAYPSAKGVSFDLEAYCTNLEDYKKKFQNYFSLPTTVAK
ncbi:hypothetical protein IKB17_02590 [bacterium]|nr:hypothetical protein [bacterium]